MEHEAIFKALRTIGINKIYGAILEDIYTGATSKVHTDNQVSEKEPTLRGMRHGDPVSPKLSTETIWKVFDNAQLEEKGINLGGEILLDLRFADDVAQTTILKTLNIS